MTGRSWNMPAFDYRISKAPDYLSPGLVWKRQESSKYVTESILMVACLLLYQKENLTNAKLTDYFVTKSPL